jgi:hypothetical protein
VRSFFTAGIANLMSLLSSNIEDEETVTKITAILRNVMQFATAPDGAGCAAASRADVSLGTCGGQNCSWPPRPAHFSPPRWHLQQGAANPWH